MAFSLLAGKDPSQRIYTQRDSDSAREESILARLRTAAEASYVRVHSRDGRDRYLPARLSIEVATESGERKTFSTPSRIR
jgi:hypothetical protein